MIATSPSRVLVVDDDRVFRLSTAELLRQDGYEVVAAADGQEAVEELRQARFDLMLLDLRMPGTGGLGVVEALRRWGDGIPILMISGAGTIDSAVRALHLGADDFLTKPVEPEILSARVAELLERRPGAEASGAAFAGMVGPLTPDAQRFRRHRTGSTHRCDGAHHRRNRHRQGAGRARAARPLGPVCRAVRPRQLCRASGGSARIRAVRACAGRVHRGSAGQEGIVRGPRPAALCSWTKSPTSLPHYSSGCCGRFRSARSAA